MVMGGKRTEMHAEFTSQISFRSLIRDLPVLAFCLKLAQLQLKPANNLLFMLGGLDTKVGKLETGL